MKKNFMKGIATPLLLLLLLSSIGLAAGRSGVQSKEIKQNQLQRVIGSNDERYTTKSNVRFAVTNNGVTAHNSIVDSGACFWPRGSNNSYIYGSGIWFTCLKEFNGEKRKMLTISYNPSKSNAGHTVPGRIEDGISIKPLLKDRYQTYMSTDYNTTTGLPIDPSDKTPWPLWKQDGSNENKFGQFVFDLADRNATKYPWGPSFISDEDFFCVYKDTDTLKYVTDTTKPLQNGYPLRLQFEQTVYSWGVDEFKDMLMIKYKVINYSQDTLEDCWLAPIYDTDLSQAGGDSVSVANDRARYYYEDDTLDLAVCYTSHDAGESDYGYLGISMLYTPSINVDGFVRHDKPLYSQKEQLGCKTLRIFTLSDDYFIMEHAYDYMNTETFDYSRGPADIRLLLATGPVNLKPGDTASVMMMLNFAPTAKGGEADATTADMSELIKRVKAGRGLFYRNLVTSIENELMSTSDLRINDISPNPAINICNISYNIPEDAHLSYNVYDLMGQKLFSGENIYCGNGMNNIELNTSLLGNGMYFIQLNSCGKTVFGKFSVLK